MTVDGTIHKTGILAVVLMLGFGLTWAGITHGHIPLTPGALWRGLITGFILAMIISFVPTTAPYLSCLYAPLPKASVSARFSITYETRFHGIVMQAALLTFVTIFAMLFAYRTGLIVVNNTFRAVVGGAIMAIMGFYLIGIVCMLLRHSRFPALASRATWMSIGITCVIAIVAALSLALDFDYIAQNAGTAPKYMEGTEASSLMVTVVWLYITLLRLLASIRGRD